MKPRDDQGSGSLLVLWVAVALLSATMLAVLWATVSLTTHRLKAAADLTALSAAQSARTGDPCATADRIAELHHANVTSCVLDGETVTVELATDLELGAIGSPTLTTRSRAGPVGAETPEGADWEGER
ncbi:secretion/DNA translocation related TadE-like protein [Kribbella amoyensis]|uniref:Secretion/DNA translocation related TadE-like protein n=1 Tax=Kribbella amoyensis TaxID=996641 RepID=A0A561BQG9_9ACTN|nr:secretion/DNA translocation related TadE-like protein [Kribbella amoyensis]